jgi:hypothetical protein
MLTQDHKTQQMEVCQDLLHQSEAEGDKFLDSIVTGDETWCHHYKPESKRQSEKNNIQKRKWTTFKYFGPEIRTITKLVKNTEVGISYITKNNIKHLLRINENRNDKYNISGVYQLQCAECP